MSNDLHVLESLPAYVLGSLEKEEARLVAEHLTACYLCRKELDEFQQVADQLPLAVPEALPSSDLKRQLMERIQNLDRRQSPRSVSWRYPKRLLPVGAFTALFLIILLAVSNLLLWQRMDHLEVLTGPLGMRAISLQNTTAAPAASGFVVMGRDGQNGVLVVDRLAPLDAKHEYQVWLVRDNMNTSGGVFVVDETGYRGMRIDAPDSLLTYSSVWVTIEPAGGSTAPTGEQVLNGSLFNP